MSIMKCGNCKYFKKGMLMDDKCEKYISRPVWIESGCLEGELKQYNNISLGNFIDSSYIFVTSSDFSDYCPGKIYSFCKELHDEYFKNTDHNMFQLVKIWPNSVNSITDIWEWLFVGVKNEIGVHKYMTPPLFTEPVNNEKEPSKVRNPIGIKPKRFWIQERINELKACINRYTDANLYLKEEWITEYNELITWKEALKTKS